MLVAKVELPGGEQRVAVLVVGALLPRPFSETPPWNPTRAITGERSASDYAVNRDSGGKGEGRSGETLAGTLTDETPPWVAMRAGSPSTCC
jgi:hypothetical protein